MSKTKLFFVFIFILTNITDVYSSEKSKDFWDITVTESLINMGNLGEAFLTIRLDEVPRDTIDFRNTIIIGIDLENPDPTFKAKVHKYKSTENEEIYKIDFSSETIGKNNFIITLYDYENQRSIKLEPTEFEYGETEVEEIIPDPNKTNLIKNPLEYVGENDTITFEFSLVDTNGYDIIGNKSFINKLKVINNGKHLNTANITLSEDGKIFNVSFFPEYLPLLQEINIEFNGQSNKFNLFSENLKVIVIVYPFYLNTQVECENCENKTIGENLSINISLYNYKNISVDTDDYSESFDIIIEGPMNDEVNRSLNNISVVKQNKDGNLYGITISMNETFIYTGKYKISVFENNTLIAEFEFMFYNDIDIDGFILEFLDPLFNPKKAYIDTEFGMVLKARDKFSYYLNLSFSEYIEVKLVDESGEEIKYEKTLYDDAIDGYLKIYITSHTQGFAKLVIFYKEKEIKKVNTKDTLPEFYFNLIKCVKSKLSKEELDNAVVGQDITIYLQCIDKLNNFVKHGGEDFSSDNYIISEEKYTSFEVKINDFNNGNYSFNFKPSIEGNYYIIVYLDNELFIEINFEIGIKHCDNSTPFLCPNKNLCVKDLIECIEPKNDCPKETPFSCNKNGEKTCVESQTECDCPEGYYRCDYMKYCVPNERKDMCANYKDISEQTCKKLKQYKYLCEDGICRLDLKLTPTQKVCPIGMVLCADLSCRNSYDECAVSDYCEDGEFRCGDQSCVNDYTECPSTISCQNKKYVCPDGTCVDNEVECKALPTCSGEEPYRCQDNLCAKDKNSCVKNIACGQRMALCQDLICRTTCENL